MSGDAPKQQETQQDPKPKSPKKKRTSKKTKSKKATRKKKKKPNTPNKKSGLSKAEMQALGSKEVRNRIFGGMEIVNTEEEKKAANPVGRPTAYQKEYCADLIEHMKEGGSFESFGAAIGEKYGWDYAVCRKTLYLWADAQPDFLHAKGVGKEASLRWFENTGRMGMLGRLMRVSKRTAKLDLKGDVILDGKGNVVYDQELEPATFGAVPWKFSMKNKHGWRENIEITGDNRGPIKQKTEIDLTKLSTKELIALDILLNKSVTDEDEE